MLLDVPGKLSEADAAISGALTYTDGLLREDPGNYRMRYNRVYLLLRSGKVALRLGRAQDAARHYRVANQEAAGLLDGPDGPAARNLRLDARIQLARIQRSAALADEAAREIEANPKLLPDPWTTASAFGDLGRAFCACGHKADASKWLAKSVAAWAGLKVVPQLEERRKAESASAAKALASCR